MPPRVRLRRVVVLLGITLLLPGSAQMLAGRRRLGRVVVGVWLTMAGVVVALGLTATVNRAMVVSVLSRPAVLGVLTGVCLVWAVLWPLLVLDAWRLGRVALLPRRLRRRLTATVLVLVAVTSLPLVALGRRTLATAEFVHSVFGDGARTEAVDGRYTVLLLGGDAGRNRVGLRPDSITLASIDARTGRTVLFGLPRNLEDVPFPRGSRAARAMPRGWSCGDDCLLNGVYTWGRQHPDLFPGARDPGAEAMKQAVSAVLGLPVNYYVLVDLRGFRRLVDALGGVDLVVGSRVPIGGGTSPVSGYIEPGRRHLDGYHALWFARSRHGSIDYARMARQRCVMTAMLDQMDPATVLLRFERIAAASRDVLRTDVPGDRLATFVDLGLRAKGQRVASVQFVPPLVRPAYPDYREIHRRVRYALERSETPAGRGSTVRAAGVPRTRVTGATSGGSEPGRGVSPGADDVRAVCRAG